mgnify:CR=1 FL=1
MIIRTGALAATIAGLICLTGCDPVDPVEPTTRVDADSAYESSADSDSEFEAAPRATDPDNPNPDDDDVGDSQAGIPTADETSDVERE